jgi:hypothetical protein
MFVFYLDDSGTDARSPVITMAGYLAHKREWKRFERNARRYLDQAKVPLLHAKEFHDRKGAFKSWTPSQQISFVQGLYDIARDHSVLGMSLSIRKDVYKKRALETGKNASMSAYAQCFGILLERLLKHPQLVDDILKSGLSFVVERGNKNNEDVRLRYEALRNFRELAMVLKDIRFVTKDDSCAIQLADFLAFYSRRHAEACEKAGGKEVAHDAFLHIMAEAILHDVFVATDFS